MKKPLLLKQIMNILFINFPLNSISLRVSLIITVAITEQEPAKCVEILLDIFLGPSLHMFPSLFTFSEA